MINLELTELGRAFVSENKSLVFPSFVASSSFDIEDTEAYLRGSYRGSEKFIKFPAVYAHVLPYGEIYNIGYESYMRDHSEARIGGILSLSEAGSRFEVNSIALCCCDPGKEKDSKDWAVYAFGSLELNTYPLPVQPDDSVSYAIPFSVSYGSRIPNLSVIGDGRVPWKLFLDHAGSRVTEPEQVHGAWFDLSNYKIRVGSTSLDIPVSSGGSEEERIARLEEEVALAVKYRNLESSDSSFIAAVDSENSYVENSFVQRSKLSSRLPKTALSVLSQLFSNALDNNSTVKVTYHNRVHWNVNVQTWSQGLDSSFASADFVFIIPCSKGWFTSRMVYTINRSENKCYFTRGDASQEAWTSYFYVALWRAEVVTVPDYQLT